MSSCAGSKGLVEEIHDLHYCITQFTISYELYYDPLGTFYDYYGSSAFCLIPQNIITETKKCIFRPTQWI